MSNCNDSKQFTIGSIDHAKWESLQRKPPMQVVERLTNSRRGAQQSCQAFDFRIEINTKPSGQIFVHQNRSKEFL